MEVKRRIIELAESPSELSRNFAVTEYERQTHRESIDKNFSALEYQIKMKWRKSLHRYGTLPIRKDDCAYVWSIPPRNRCDWVQQNEDCDLDGHVQYADLLFCTFGTESKALFALGFCSFILWLLYLFLMLATTSDNFFCPSLSIIADVFRLSENIAGVTILAFGNGAPDIFTSLVADGGDEKVIIFTELIGAGIFVTSIIAGSVAVFAPFRVTPKPFMRDCCFYAVAVSWIAYVTEDNIVHLWEGIISIYFIFIAVVVGMQCYDNFIAKQKIQTLKTENGGVSRSSEEKDDDSLTQSSLKPGSFSVLVKLDVAIATEKANVQARGETIQIAASNDPSSGPDANRPEGLFKELLYDINPINGDEWRKSCNFVRIVMLVRAPVMLLLQLFVPVVNETAMKRGWSKLLNCIQLCLTPSLATILLGFHRMSVGPIPLIVLIVFFTAIISIIVFSKTEKNRPPKYHNIFAFFGFLDAMIVVWLIANEVMSLLQCIGFASGISDAMLGITLLAWGNSVGDLISNVAIARQGYPRMGYSACFGGPMFNTLLGLGLTWTMAAARQPDYRAIIRTSSMMDGCLAFLLCSLATSAIYLNIMGFLARRSYGFLLYSIYFVFIFINFLSEIHVIHPLGTDHRE